MNLAAETVRRGLLWQPKLLRRSDSGVGMGRQAVHHTAENSRAISQSQLRPLHPHNLQTRPEAQGHTSVGFAPSEMPLKSHFVNLRMLYETRFWSLCLGA